MANLKWLFWYYASALDLSHGALTTLFIHSQPLDYPESWEIFECEELRHMEKKYGGSPIWQVRRKGKLHCPFGPALIMADGTQKWYRKGKPHRVSGPAVERPDGTKKWYRKGLLDRQDGPAIELANGVKKWCRKGQLHRKYDLPAVIWPHGLLEWYCHGERHRKCYLPALECSHGSMEWYEHGIQGDVNDWPDACFDVLNHKRRWGGALDP